MDYDDHHSRSHREIFLSTILGVLGLGFALFVLFLICGGLSLYIMAVVAGLGFFGLAHYLLWGRSLNREVAGEREAQEWSELLEDDGLVDEE